MAVTPAAFTILSVPSIITNWFLRRLTSASKNKFSMRKWAKAAPGQESACKFSEVAVDVGVVLDVVVVWVEELTVVVVVVVVVVEVVLEVEVEVVVVRVVLVEVVFVVVVRVEVEYNLTKSMAVYA